MCDFPLLSPALYLQLPGTGPSAEQGEWMQAVFLLSLSGSSLFKGAQHKQQTSSDVTGWERMLAQSPTLQPSGPLSHFHFGLGLVN